MRKSLRDELRRLVGLIPETDPTTIEYHTLLASFEGLYNLAGPLEEILDELDRWDQAESIIDIKVIPGGVPCGEDCATFVSRLNGSTGVSGAADTIVTLTRGKRGDQETKMSITGRDVTERTLVIQMDWSNYRWICLGDERDVERDHDQYAFQTDPLVKTILWHLDEAEELAPDDAEQVEWRCTSAGLLAAVVALYGPQESDSATAMGRRVTKLVPQLESQAGVVYEYHKTNARREHVFTREIL